MHIDINERINKMKLLNPLVYIGISTKNRKVIWADVRVGELVLPPGLEYAEDGINLKFKNIVIEVRQWGE